MDDLVAHLQDLTRPDRQNRYLQAGIARIDAHHTQHFMCGDGVGPDDLPRVRVASISKLATALLINALIADGHLTWDTCVADVLPWATTSASVGHLLTHTSGLTDLGGYIFEPPEQVAEVLSHPPTRSDHRPGSYFRYCNLGYILLGQIAEMVTQTRFDVLIQEQVLRPAGIAGGFNWAGVPVADRASRLPLFQRRDAAYGLEIDGPGSDWEAEMLWRGGAGRSFEGHRLGLDAAYLSPHAGLRAHVVEIARLAWQLGTTQVGRAMQEETWAYDPKAQNGMTGGGLFERYGRGVSIYRDHDRIASPLVGHAGHALGFTGGAWFNPQTQVAWAYMLTGAADETEDEDDEVFFPPAELSILQSF